MAVGIILRGVLALFIGGALSFVVIPTMYELYSDTSLWSNVSGTAITTRNNLYTLFQYLPITICGSIATWMFVAAVRHDPYDNF